MARRIFTKIISTVLTGTFLASGISYAGTPRVSTQNHLAQLRAAESALSRLDDRGGDETTQNAPFLAEGEIMAAREDVLFAKTEIIKFLTASIDYLKEMESILEELSDNISKGMVERGTIQPLYDKFLAAKNRINECIKQVKPADDEIQTAGDGTNIRHSALRDFLTDPCTQNLIIYIPLEIDVRFLRKTAPGEDTSDEYFSESIAHMFEEAIMCMDYFLRCERIALLKQAGIFSGSIASLAVRVDSGFATLRTQGSTPIFSQKEGFATTAAQLEHHLIAEAASAGTEAEQAAESLLEWAELVLRAEQETMDDGRGTMDEIEHRGLKPPVWGKVLGEETEHGVVTLTPEVAYELESPCRYWTPAKTAAKQGKALTPEEETAKFHAAQINEATLHARILLYFEASLVLAGIEDEQMLKFLRDNRPGIYVSDDVRARRRAVVEGRIRKELNKKGGSDVLDSMSRLGQAANTMLDGVLEWSYRTVRHTDWRHVSGVGGFNYSQDLYSWSIDGKLSHVFRKPYALHQFDYQLILGMSALRASRIASAIERIQQGMRLRRKYLEEDAQEDIAARQAAHALAQLALSEIGAREITLQEDFDGHEKGATLTIAQACCHVAWALKDEHPQVWTAFKGAVEAGGRRIVVDELTERRRITPGITFTLVPLAEPEAREAPEPYGGRSLERGA